MLKAQGLGCCFRAVTCSINLCSIDLLKFDFSLVARRA